jgi:transcriptional regulator with XRE-family HTH domain
VQTITTPGGEKLIVLTEEEYEDLIDTRDAIAAEQDLAAGRMETFSSDEVMASLSAPTPLAFWRSWRHVPAAELARFANISEEYLAELEAGRAVADVGTYVRLARRLRTHVESLIREEARAAHGAEAAE